jgi:hypothetical protein
VVYFYSAAKHRSSGALWPSFAPARVRGWQELRDQDLGILWEHFVLNEMMAYLQTREVGYWRDERGHEMDFVLAGGRKSPLAIECKWFADRFDPGNLVAFRTQHPDGENVVLAEDITRSFTRNYGTLKVRFESLAHSSNS